MRESVNVTVAGGPTPQADWRPNDLTPDFSRAVTGDSLRACDALAFAYGVLSAWFHPQTTGRLVREA